MKPRKISFVYRDDVFSPNNVENDSHILDKVAQIVAPYFEEVEHLSEAEFAKNGTDAQIIIDMCRSKEALDRLNKYQHQGRLVINSGYSIINCFRDNVTRIMQQNNIPMPTCYIVETKAVELPQEVLQWDKFWVKRGEGHSMVKNDIQQVNSIAQAKEAIMEYRQRNIASVVLSEHIEGDLVKFYGIKDSEYFFCFYPAEEAHSKFGQELLSPKPHHFTYAKDELYNICQKLAKELDLEVFGGDCIIGEDHSIYLIDFNDWPSFAPCLEPGARHIANQIMLRVAEYLPDAEENEVNALNEGNALNEVNAINARQASEAKDINKTENTNHRSQTKDDKNNLGTCH